MAVLVQLCAPITVSTRPVACGGSLATSGNAHPRSGVTVLAASAESLLPPSFSFNGQTNGIQPKMDVDAVPDAAESTSVKY
ncbi:unnamed protein product [Schistocephalus solidus]|uniref:Secreted protein n=1 Tax=Schistocephalus solidus TaxID=70667 RepID=A0A183TH62_SCHSO|nr:unnamed protein product [Schistocephalus solidus]